MDDQSKRGKPHFLELLSWLVAIATFLFAVAGWIYDRFSGGQHFSDEHSGIRSEPQIPPSPSSASLDRELEPAIDAPSDGVVVEAPPADHAAYQERMSGRWVVKQEDCPNANNGTELKTNVAWQQFYIRDDYLIIDSFVGPSEKPTSNSSSRIKQFKEDWIQTEGGYAYNFSREGILSVRFDNGKSIPMERCK
jgi:hypothetical protein